MTDEREFLDGHVFCLTQAYPGFERITLCVIHVGHRMCPLFVCGPRLARCVHAFTSLARLAVRHLLGRYAGILGFFVGWQANLTKDVPFAALKLSLYEGTAYATHELVRATLKKDKESRGEKTTKIQQQNTKWRAEETMRERMN